MIDLTVTQKKCVIAIIRLVFEKNNHNKNPVVYIFGSRVKNTARQFSDLDIALKAEYVISGSVICELKEAFSESDLPFMVDIIDLLTISTDFYQAIKAELIQLKI